MDPVILLLEIYLEDIPPTKQKYIQARLLIKALIVIAEYWKQSKFPYKGEKLNKLQYVHIMESYAAVKKRSLSINMH